MCGSSCLIAGGSWGTPEKYDAPALEDQKSPSADAGARAPAKKRQRAIEPPSTPRAKSPPCPSPTKIAALEDGSPCLGSSSSGNSAAACAAPSIAGGSQTTLSVPPEMMEMLQAMMKAQQVPGPVVDQPSASPPAAAGAAPRLAISDQEKENDDFDEAAFKPVLVDAM